MPTLKWIGKKDIKNHHNNIEYRVLDCKESVGEANSGNLIVKGDNLLALKSLLPYYAGQVKMIYIDPPYNTGNTSWIYNDNVDSPIIRKWFEKNIDSNDLGRSDKWLCMMYPRLKLLEKFLKEDGVIFVSIDDAELATLKILMDSIFGKDKFISIIQWKRSESQNNNAKHLSKVGEFILCYSKGDKKDIEFNSVDLNLKALKEYRYEDSVGRFRRGTIIDKTRGKNIYKVVSPTGIEVEIQSIRTKEWFEEKDNEGLIYWTKSNTPYGKIYLEGNTGQKASNWFDNCGVNEDASEELANIGIEFPFSKPYTMIQKLIKLVSSKDGDIIMDSFAGSGTTAQAVLEQNKLDGISRKFILIEMEEYAKKTTAERVKRIINGYSYKGKKKYSLIEPIKLSMNNILDSKKMEKIQKEISSIINENENLYDKIEKVLKDNTVFLSGIKTFKDFKEGLGGGFQYCELSEPLLDEFGLLNETVSFEMLSKHIFFTEFGIALNKEQLDESKNLSGIFEDKALYIFLDKRFNILSLTKILEDKHEKYIVYADSTTISKEELNKHNITFKKIPFDIKGN